MSYFAPNLRRTYGPRDGRCRFAVHVAAPCERNRLRIQQLTLCFALSFTQLIALWLCTRAGFHRSESGLGRMGLRYAPG